MYKYIIMYTNDNHLECFNISKYLVIWSVVFGSKIHIFNTIEFVHYFHNFDVNNNNDSLITGPRKLW